MPYTANESLLYSGSLSMQLSQDTAKGMLKLLAAMHGNSRADSQELFETERLPAGHCSTTAPLLATAHRCPHPTAI